MSSDDKMDASIILACTLTGISGIIILLSGLSIWAYLWQTIITYITVSSLVIETQNGGATIVSKALVVLTAYFMIRSVYGDGGNSGYILIHIMNIAGAAALAKSIFIEDADRQQDAGETYTIHCYPRRRRRRKY